MVFPRLSNDFLSSNFQCSHSIREKIDFYCQNENWWNFTTKPCWRAISITLISMKISSTFEVYSLHLWSSQKRLKEAHVQPPTLSMAVSFSLFSSSSSFHLIKFLAANVIFTQAVSFSRVYFHDTQLNSSLPLYFHFESSFICSQDCCGQFYVLILIHLVFKFQSFEFSERLSEYHSRFSSFKFFIVIDNREVEFLDV